MRYLPSRRTIISDLSGILFVVVILVVAAIGLSMNHILADRFEKELDFLADDLTENLAENLARPLWNKDYSKITSVAEEALNFRVLKGLAVTDQKGATLFSRQPEYKPQKVVFKRPIKWEGRTIGSVSTTFTKDVRSRVRKAVTIITLFTIVILSSTVLLATILVLRLRLLRPFSEIKNGIEKIAGGDYEMRLPVMPLADINSIALGVNEMTRQIAERTENLKAQIHARLEAAALLAESEQRYEAMLEATPDPVVTVDVAGTILYFNPAFTGVLGWSLDECRSQPAECLFPDSGAHPFRELFVRLLNGDVVSGMEIETPCRDGSAIPVSVSAAAYRDSDGRPVGFVVSLRDLRSRKSIEEKLIQAQKMHAVGTLAAGIAHDMNNLFMGIQGYTSLMQLSTDKSSQSWERLKKIEHCVATGATLTRQLLGVTRGGKYEVKPIDLNSVVESQNSFFSRSHKEISIRAEYFENLWTVEADRSQIELVLLNLYTNAWQSMGDKGEIVVRTQNEVFYENTPMPPEARPGHYVLVSVTDTGVGMDEATQKKIFEPFFTSKDIGRGVGLGLWSTYGIIKAHDGFITVQSRLEKGSTFTLYLPATRKDAQNHAVIEDGILRGDETILLVDDEEMILSVGRELLETLGYNVFASGDGKGAVDTVKKHADEIRLVVLDMIMPDMSGGETFAAIKAIVPGMRVLLASGYSRDGQAQAILDQGCDGFIQKPFTIEDLSRKVREILDK